MRRLPLLLAFACETGPDYGPWTSGIRKSAAALAARPCESAVLYDLTALYVKAGQKGLAVERFDQFRQACPADPELDAEAYRVAMDAGRWDSAASAATPAIAADPSRPSPLLKRAAAYEAKLDWATAAKDLRQAFLIEPKAIEASKRLAAAQEHTGELCRAWETWGMIWWLNSKVRGEAQVARSRLADAGGCRSLRVTGEYSTKQKETPDGLYYFAAQMGEFEVRLGVDSAAPYSSISADLAAKLALTIEPTLLISRSAYGTSAGSPTQLPVVHLGELAIDKLDALVVEHPEAGVDGLLGINFLTRVDMDRVDSTRWRFRARGL